MVEDGDRDHTRDGLGQQNAKPAEAEELGAGRLNPEAQRRLVDGHETAGVEGGEEKVVPALQHALDGGGVVGVAVALGVELV